MTALLLPIGVLVGLIGSLIGVGGGFFVVPFLLHVLDGFTKDSATAASLGIVLLSAASGTLANGRRRRIDYRTGLMLAAGTLPGAWLGRELIRAISDRTFAYSFGGLLVAVAVYVLFVRLKKGRGLVRGTPRVQVDSEGQAHAYEVNGPLGFAASLAIGVISSLFGIGGGLVLVPFLVIAYGMPSVCATAAAQFTFLFASAMGLAVSVARGQMTPAGWRVIGLLGLGVVVGAHVGVAVAKKLPERVFRAMLAAVILTVAALMVFRK